MGIFLPLLITTAITTASKIAGNIAQARTAKRNTNLTIAANKQQAELAYSREKEQLAEMNKYNLPSSQMSRFTDAGLNRNLIYTQGNPGNQSQLARYNPPNLQYNYKAKFQGNEFDSIKDLPLMSEQIKNLMSIGKINEAKATMETALAKYAQLLAQTTKEKLLSENAKYEFEKIMGRAKLRLMFDPVPDSRGVVEWELKPGMEELFVQSLVTDLMMPTTILGKHEADLRIKNTLSDQMKFLPWLRPLFEFLKILKP